MPEAQVGASPVRGLEIVHAFGHWPRAHAPFFPMLGSFTPCCLSLTPHKTSEERPDSLNSVLRMGRRPQAIVVDVRFCRRAHDMGIWYYGISFKEPQCKHSLR